MAAQKWAVLREAKESRSRPKSTSSASNSHSFCPLLAPLRALSDRLSRVQTRFVTRYSRLNRFPSRNRLTMVRRVIPTLIGRLNPLTSLLIRPQDRLVQRYSKSAGATSRRYALENAQVEEYGYALPLGRGIEKCPVPAFDMPATVDVSTPSLSLPTQRSRKLTLTRVNPPCSRPRSSNSTPTTCRTRRAGSRSTTVRRPSHSSSRAASSLPSTRERQPEVTSVRQRCASSASVDSWFPHLDPLWPSRYLKDASLTANSL